MASFLWKLISQLLDWTRRNGKGLFGMYWLMRILKLILDLFVLEL